MKNFLYGILATVVLHPALCAQEMEHNRENFNPVWVKQVLNAYKGLMEGPDIATADMLFAAAEAMPKKNWEMYLLSATIYAPNTMREQALQGVDKAIESGLRDENLLKSLPALKQLHDTEEWGRLLQKIEGLIAEEQNRIENPEVLHLLKDLWEKDQSALSEYNQQLQQLDSAATEQQAAILFLPVKERWNSNKKYLDSIVDLYGWPGFRLVGKEGTKIAWAIAQHHPDIFFKEKCLALIGEAAKIGDTDINHFAELSDRISRDTWRKQQYGTSFGNGFAYPIASPHLVNTRRKELGLAEPIEVYAIYHGVDYTPPQPEESIKMAKANHRLAQKCFTVFKDLLQKGSVDDGMSQLKKAIDFYGDLTDTQLYTAAVLLSKTGSEKALNMSFRILKVLIYRHSDVVEEMLSDTDLLALHTKPTWKELVVLLTSH